MRYFFCFLIFWCGSNVHAQTVQDSTINGRPFVVHLVQTQETLYGIAREYNAELNQIVVQNPSVIQGLKVGMKILVPLQKPRTNEEKGVSKIFNVFKKKTKTTNKKPTLIVSDSAIVKAALLLPFYLDMNDTLEAHNDTRKLTAIYPKSTTAIQYYSGVLLALDVLKSLGYSVDMKVLDVPNDSVCMAILDSTILDDRSLILGPLHANQFKKLANRYGLDTNRRLVSPLSYKNVIKNHENTYQFVPFSNVQIDTIVGLIAKKHSSENLLIIGSEQEMGLVRKFKSSLSVNTDLKYKSYTVSEGLPDKEMMKQKLDESENVVLVASNNRAFVSRVIPMLASMEDTVFTVYGLESWNRITSLDEIELNFLNVHYPSVFFQDENQLFNGFRDNYHHRFKEYPSKYAYAAYKQFLFLIADSFTGLYDFQKVQNQKGWINTRFPIVFIQDYKQQIIDY